MEYLFFLLRDFLYYANEKSDDVKKKIHLNNKILNQEYLQKYWSGVLQTWQQKCTSEKKQNDTHFAVTMRTLLAPVSFCEKPIQIPQFTAVTSNRPAEALASVISFTFVVYSHYKHS